MTDGRRVDTRRVIICLCRTNECGDEVRDKAEHHIVTIIDFDRDALIWGMLQNTSMPDVQIYERRDNNRVFRVTHEGFDVALNYYIPGSYRYRARFGRLLGIPLRAIPGYPYVFLFIGSLNEPDTDIHCARIEIFSRGNSLFNILGRALKEVYGIDTEIIGVHPEKGILSLGKGYIIVAIPHAYVVENLEHCRALTDHREFALICTSRCQALNNYLLMKYCESGKCVNISRFNPKKFKSFPLTIDIVEIKSENGNGGHDIVLNGRTIAKLKYINAISAIYGVIGIEAHALKYDGNRIKRYRVVKFFALNEPQLKQLQEHSVSVNKDIDPTCMFATGIVGNYLEEAPAIGVILHEDLYNELNRTYERAIKWFNSTSHREQVTDLLSALAIASSIVNYVAFELGKVLLTKFSEYHNLARIIAKMHVDKILSSLLGANVRSNPFSTVGIANLLKAMYYPELEKALSMHNVLGVLSNLTAMETLTKVLEHTLFHYVAKKIIAISSAEEGTLRLTMFVGGARHQHLVGIIYEASNYGMGFLDSVNEQLRSSRIELFNDIGLCPNGTPSDLLTIALHNATSLSDAYQRLSEIYREFEEYLPLRILTYSEKILRKAMEYTGATEEDRAFEIVRDIAELKYGLWSTLGIDIYDDELATLLMYRYIDGSLTSALSRYIEEKLNVYAEQKHTSVRDIVKAFEAVIQGNADDSQMEECRKVLKFLATVAGRVAMSACPDVCGVCGLLKNCSYGRYLLARYTLNRRLLFVVISNLVK